MSTPVEPSPPSSVDAAAAPTETQFVADAIATQFVADAPARATPTLPPIGALPRFGRFQALAPLGAGATGSVYRAHDDVLGRAVAIKVLHGQGELAVRARFLHEARAVGAVVHPNIVAIFDVGTDAAMPYLVMELAAGGSLRDQLQQAPHPGLAVETVRTVGIQIARALAAAHAAGILHRDVKPANILRCRTADGASASDDVWKLADFGIARLPDSTLTLDGQFLGSPAYAAPEALRAGLFSPASDVYALGATLYEALAGEPPHGAEDVRVIVRKLDEDVRPLPAFVPRALAAAIVATLARDPAHRPSAEQLARALAASAVDADPAPAPARTWPRVVAIGAAVVAIALWIVFFTRDRGAPAAAPPAKLVETAAPEPTPSADAPAAAAPSPPSEPTVPAPSAEPSVDDEAAPLPDYAEAPPAWPPPSSEPVIIDEHGEVVDDAAARALLERMERDARAAYDRSWRKRGRGRWRRD